MSGRGLALLCHPYHRGGVTRWMADVAGAWRRVKGDCWFVTPRPRAPFVSGERRLTLTQLLEMYPPEARPFIVSPSVGSEFEFGTTAYRAAIYARAVLNSVPPNVPVIVSDDPAVWMAGAQLSSRNPLVGVLHADDEPYYELARQFGQGASALVCVSERIKRRAETFEECFSVPLATIPCGIPLPGSNRTEPQNMEQALRLIWVGRVDEHQKRVSDLPKIAESLRGYGIKFQLSIVGDGSELETLKRSFVEKGLTEQVRLPGWLSTPEVAGLMAESDVLLLPSNYEGMPVSVMEALGAGCAVVASRTSGVEDYESHPLAKDCLWVHAVGDVREAARLIILAAKVPRARRVEQAKALAETEFSITRCVEKYDELIARLSLSKRQDEINKISNYRVTALISRLVAMTRIARLRVSGHHRAS